MGLLDGLVMPPSKNENAKFMGFFERLKFLNIFQKGFVLDGRRRISLKSSFNHVLCSAKSGNFKTSSIVVPNLLLADYYSIVAYDPAKELYELSHKHLERKGYDVKVLDFTNPQISERYNPLTRLKNATDVRKMSDTIITASFPNAMGGDSAFWNISGADLNFVVISSVLGLPKDKQNFKEVYRILNKIESDRDEINKLMVNTLDEDTLSLYKSFLSMDDKLRSSIISTARAALGKYADPDIAEITSSETLNFEQLRTGKKSVIFISVEESDPAYYAPILNVLYSQLFRFCLKMPQKGEEYRPIMFLLEEFPALGKIESFSTMISVLRKRKIGLMLIIQDISQLFSIYGKFDAETIINNCSSQLYFGALPLDTAERLSRILGDRLVLSKEKPQRIFEAPTLKESTKRLMSAQELRMMEEAILIYGNLAPLKFKPKPYFKSRKLRRRTR